VPVLLIFVSDDRVQAIAEARTTEKRAGLFAGLRT
jgi:hypothetical protein